MSNLESETIFSGNRIFTEFKGALTEQYDCQELVAAGLVPYYWSAENSCGVPLCAIGNPKNWM